jgi:hypothetical protein
MNRDKLRRYALRIVAAAALGAGLVVGVGVANAETTDTGTVTYIKVVTPPGTATTLDTVWE